jgi:AraC family transcriptional regulator of adaptative response / DNA-3-methyladenine glycosylase II
MDKAAYYSALSARDRRFDGVFYVGVTSTGIYCRPVCTARTPKAANCRFFVSREAAEKASFRPCLKCRPELAPGTAPVDDAQRIAHLLAQRIDEGLLDNGDGMEAVAKKFGWSSRQIRRIVQKELGVSPIELVLSRRLLLAKQLLTETTLPITEVAFASGFASLRRFNDAFGSRYGMPPTRFRKSADSSTTSQLDSSSFTLQLGYRPPFAWKRLIGFLGARGLAGVEHVSDAYRRTVRLGEHTGIITVRDNPERNTLRVEVSHSLTPVLPALLGRLRNLFDLSARPDVIATHLRRDQRLRALIRQSPGLRVPGAFDGFELAVRAILGQQVSVKAATTLGGRFVMAFGEKLRDRDSELTHTSPTAADVAAASVKDIASLGSLGTRAATILKLADQVASGAISLEAGADPRVTMEQLVSLPGIGPWTANYIAMRALRWPDAFPAGDLVMRQRLGGVSSPVAETMSEGWRPWRSYATLHLWTGESIANDA